MAAAPAVPQCTYTRRQTQTQSARHIQTHTLFDLSSRERSRDDAAARASRTQTQAQSTQPSHDMMFTGVSLEVGCRPASAPLSVQTPQLRQPSATYSKAIEPSPPPPGPRLPSAASARAATAQRRLRHAHRLTRRLLRRRLLHRRLSRVRSRPRGGRAPSLQGAGAKTRRPSAPPRASPGRSPCRGTRDT